MLQHLALFLALVPQASEVPDVVTWPYEVQVQRIQAHYAAVVEELSAADVTRLTCAQRLERERLIGVLRDFGACGDFGSNPIAGVRWPLFRDEAGRRCAVAELMNASGEASFVESVRVSRNALWIVDLMGDPAFEAWLERSGLCLEEAQRIHGPPLPPGPPSPPSGGDGGRGGVGDPGPGGTTRPAAGGSYSGPGDTSGGSTGGSGGASTGSGGGGAATTPTSGTPTGGSGGTGGGASTPSAAPSAVSLTTTDDDGWWLWWEYNKTEFLKPNTLGIESLAITGDDIATAFKKAIESQRAALVPILEKNLAAADWNVRASAAIAYGRVAGKGGLEKLLLLLADPNQDVRHNAILALGATGSSDAAVILLGIAQTGTRDRNSRDRISPHAKSMAIIALALGRRQGIDASYDAEIAKLVDKRVKAERDSIGVAAMIYQTLSPCSELEKVALVLADDRDETPGTRCRAIEALRHSADTNVLAKLQTHLTGPRMDMRRSAALALGELDNPLALPALCTAFELEAEPLTRGFLLTSIGRQGGVKAGSYLTKVIEKGDTGLRRWAALGLGIVGYRTQDAELRARIVKTVREAQKLEKNREAIGAFWIALGMCHDDESRVLIAASLDKAGDPRTRMYAAQGLAMINSDACAAILREKIVSEPQAHARVGMLEALGVMGRPRDAQLMLDILSRLTEPYLQGVAASAMATHGTSESLRALGELVRLEGGSNVRRAATLGGLGMMLAQAPTLQLCEAARQSNYTVFNEWVNGIFQTTL